MGQERAQGWLRQLVEQVPFPNPRHAQDDGLLAYGGDLVPERLLAAYAQGIFPWYSEEPILWFSPNPRMLLRPADLAVHRSLAKNLRRHRYEVRFDTDFEAVIQSCASVPRPGQDGTWITPDMVQAYCALHELGFAHSAEAWQSGELVGGVYGVSLGAAFFGESMFARRSDASKVAFVYLVRQIEEWGFQFLDCQVYSDHLSSLGARELGRDAFLAALQTALEVPTRQGQWRLSRDFADATAES